LDKQGRPQSPQFVSSTITLGSYSVVSVVLGLASTVIIARHFSPVEFGIYTIILVAVSFLGQISTLGVESGISRIIAGSNVEATKEIYLSTAAIMRLGAILLACLLAWIGRPYLIRFFGGYLLQEFFLYIPLLFVLESTRTFLRSILQGCLLFSKIGITDLIASSLNFLLLLVIIYFVNSGSIIWLILIKAFSSFLACAFAFITIPIKKRISFHLGAFKELIKFGFPLQINDVLSFISSRIDTLVVAALLGPAPIAFYEVARKIPDNLRNLYSPFITVYYPFLSKRYGLEDQKQASKLLNNSLRFVSFILIFGTAISILFSKEIISMLFSDEYLPSAPIFVILMINLSIALVGNVMGTTFAAMGDTITPTIINIFNATVSLLGSILFIPAFRMIGAAVANTIGTAAAYPPAILFLRKRIDLRNAAYLKPFAFLGVWSIPVFIIKPGSILMKLGFLLIFIAASFFLSIITKADILLLVEKSRILAWTPLKKFGIWLAKL
jgi:O-antigen/teichoic acid export membrane protein